MMKGRYFILTNKPYSPNVPYKEKEIEKKYYTIGEVADELGVATSLIRFWEGEFEALKKPQRI